VPVNVDQWGWSLGFYSDLEPGQHRSGSAQTFDQARADFEAAWASLLGWSQAYLAEAINVRLAAIVDLETCKALANINSGCAGFESALRSIG
jgi:hypothetical protein